MAHYDTPQSRELRDQWSSIQSNTFLDWANHWLKNRDIEISDLGKDFSDGLNLIHLVEVLSGAKVGRYVKNPRFPGQKIDNIQIAISFIEKTWNVQCIGLNAMDIMEGNHKQILGLIFLLVNKISKQYKLDYHDEGETDSSILFPTVFAITKEKQEKTVIPDPNIQVELSDSVSLPVPVNETFEQKKFEKISTKPTERRESRPRSQIIGKLVHHQEKQENKEAPPENVPKTLLKRSKTSNTSDSAKIMSNENNTKKPLSTEIPPEEITKDTPAENIDNTPAETFVNLSKGNLTENKVENIKKNYTENQTEKLPDSSSAEKTEEKTNKPSLPSPENPVEVTEDTHEKFPEVMEVKDLVQSPQAELGLGISPEQGVPEPGLEKTSDQNQNDKSPPVLTVSELSFTDESSKEPDNEATGKLNKEQIAIPKRFTEEDISYTDSGTLKTARPIKREGLPKKGSTASLKRISTGDKPRSSSFKKKDTEKKKHDSSRELQKKKSRTGDVSGGWEEDDEATTNRDSWQKKKPRGSRVLGDEHSISMGSSDADESETSEGGWLKKPRSKGEENEELFRRFENKERLVVRLQACIRRKLAKKKNSEFVIRTKFGKHVVRITRIQSMIRGHLCRLSPPNDLKRLRRRWNIAYEILSTEESYVHGLHCLTDIYLKDLRTIPPDSENVLTDLVKDIFSNVEVIYRYNSFLLGQIRKRMTNWYTDGCRIGDIFVKFVAFLKTYTAFVNNYNKAFTSLNLLSKIPTAQESLMRSRSNTESRGLDVGSFLITPIQRLPRYVLLLQDLLKNTEETHADYVNLSDAVTKMVEVADYVNEKKREAENLNAVCVVTNHLVGYPKDLGDLTTATRTYVRQGPLGVVEEPTTLESLKDIKPNQLRRRFLFVFNDLVLITKRDQGVNFLNKLTQFSKMDDTTLKLEHLESDPALEFKFVNRIDLEEMEVIDIEHHEFLENSFGLRKISSSDVAVVFSAESPKTKVDFMQDVDDAVWKLLQAARSLALGHIDDEKIIPTNSTATAEHRGILHKQNRKGEWKVKLCELVGTEFRWFSNDHTLFKDGKPPVSRSIFILKANITLWPVMDRPFCFAVSDPRGCFYFSASSGTERITWVNMLRNALRKHLKTGQKKTEANLNIASVATMSKMTNRSPNKRGSSRREKPPEPIVEKLEKKRGIKTRTLTSRGKKPIKVGTLYKEQKSEKYRKYDSVLKEGHLILEKDKKDQVSLDLLLLHAISPTIKEVKTKEPGTNLFVIEIVSDQRKDKLGADTKEELEDWIAHIKNAQEELHKVSSKKKKK